MDLQPLNEAVEEEIYAAPLDERREWVKKFLDARARRRAAQEEEDEAKEVIRDLLDEAGAEFGSVGGQVVLRYRTMSVRRLNTKKLRNDHPELADAYTNENEERRMEVIDD